MRFAYVFLAVCLLGCASETDNNQPNLALTSIVVDTHIDVPYRLHRRPADVSQATDGGDFDYPRAKAGGLDAAFMSIYIPASVDAAGEGLALANQLIDGIEQLVNDNPDKFTLARCPSDVTTAHRRDLMALPMGMENGGPIGDSHANLKALFDRGIRYITLAHSRSNALSDSSYDDNKQWGGLSQAGRKIVRHMNQLGIMVDVSHLSDDAFWHVLSETTQPVIASHSSLRSFTPGWERNMDDRMVTALGDQGGVIQINYGSSFLTQTARDYSTAQQKAGLEFMTANHLTLDSPELRAFAENYRIENPYPYATIDDVLDHIDRAVALAGINAVGIGSDYDGVGDSLPIGLKDAASYPNLVDGLRGRGYSTRAIKKILGDNILRVWRTVNRAAIEHGTRPNCVF